MKEIFLCDALRTPVGRYGGSLATVRPDDLAAHVIRSLLERAPALAAEPAQVINDVIFGCANQAGEDNRNVARMAALLAGLPAEVPGYTVNRLCGSGMESVAAAARAIRAGEAELIIAGGVESMSRAPFVMAKAPEAFARKVDIHDTTLGWRFVNERLKAMHGTEAMADTAETLARERGISRQDQDKFALASQAKAAAAQANGCLAEEIVPVTIPQRKDPPLVVAADEHPRATTLEKLAALKPITGPNGTITAGNASGVNDGAAALMVASEQAATRHGLTPLARIVAGAVAGVPPRIMGIGPVPASRKVLERAGLRLDDMHILETNEAFAAQALACTRELGIADDDPRLNPRGGAIALGHPLGMSGARLLTTALYQLRHTDAKYALCSMCIGVGQGIAMIIERV